MELKKEFRLEAILIVHVFTASRRPLQLSDINVLVSFKVIRFDKLLSLHHILFLIIFNSRDVLRLLINKNSLLFEFGFLQIPKFFLFVTRTQYDFYFYARLRRHLKFSSLLLGVR